jgi:hypothetical protein
MLTVISIMMELLMLVKFTNVLSILKMIGEMNTVQISVISIVIVHSKLLNVMVLGTVKMLLTSLLKP